MVKIIHAQDHAQDKWSVKTLNEKNSPHFVWPRNVLFHEATDKEGTWTCSTYLVVKYNSITKLYLMTSVDFPLHVFSLTRKIVCTCLYLFRPYSIQFYQYLFLLKATHNCLQSKRMRSWTKGWSNNFHCMDCLKLFSHILLPMQQTFIKLNRIFKKSIKIHVFTPSLHVRTCNIFCRL